MYRKRILVVDDEEDVSRALRARLKVNGYDVILAYDSVQAFTMAQNEKPDLILLDVMLPGGGGFVVAERLKRSQATRDIPIIVLTGISGGEERAYGAGVSLYLMKPYDPPILLDAIKDALEKDKRQGFGELRRNRDNAPSQPVNLS